jgi:hypothetical protein
LIICQHVAARNAILGNITQNINKSYVGVFRSTVKIFVNVTHTERCPLKYLKIYASIVKFTMYIGNDNQSEYAGFVRIGVIISIKLRLLL